MQMTLKDYQIEESKFLEYLGLGMLVQKLYSYCKLMFLWKIK